MQQKRYSVKPGPVGDIFLLEVLFLSPTGAAQNKNIKKEETSNLLAENNGDKIEYFYTFNRLDSIVYPKNPHNNVHFFYGAAQDASAADDFSVGRLWYQIDATGVQQFKYGRLGEVRYNMRSVAVPGDKAYWFKTEWEYDT